MSMRNTQGQAGLLAVLLVVFLLTMVLGVVGLLQTMGGRIVTQTQKDLALNAAQSGAARGAKELAASYSIWHDALNPQIEGGASKPIVGSYPPPVFDSSAPFPLSFPGQSYRLHGSNLPDTLIGLGLFRYTAEACVTGYEGAAQQSLDVGYRAAGLSVRLPTGLQVSPAVILDHDPGPATSSNHPQNFHVHGGPLVVFDSLSLDPTSDMVAAHFPRKFSKGLMSFEPATSTTDNVEYWQDANLGDEPALDLNQYRSSARSTHSDPAFANPCPVSPISANLDFVLTGNCTLDAPISALTPYGFVPFNWSAPPPSYVPGPTFYLEGAAFTTTIGRSTLVMPQAVDVPGANIIVDGAVTLDNGGTSPPVQAPWADSGDLLYFNEYVGFSPKGWEEYPYDTPLASYLFGSASPACWKVGDHSYPCKDAPRFFYRSAAPLTGAAPHTQPVAVRGLMYVGGDLNVLSGTWIIDGALIVKGHLTIAPAAQLYVMYDDSIVQFVPTTPLTITTVYERPVSSCSHFAFTED